MGSDDHRAIARAAFDAFNSGDGAVLDALLAPDCVLHQCGLLEPIRGVANIKRRRAGAFLSNPEVRLEAMVAQGDLVALHWRTSGPYDHPNQPAKRGVPISFGSMSFLRIANGRVREIWNIQDMSTVSAQLDWEE